MATKNFNMTPASLMNAGAPTAGAALSRRQTVELNYDYDDIDTTPEIREELITNASEIKRAEGRINEAVWTVGDRLNKQKAIFMANKWHGRWLPWLATETTYSPDFAQRVMAFAERFDDPSIFAGLNESALMLLGANSTPNTVIDAVATRVAEGKPPSYNEIKRMAAEAKRAGGGYDNIDDLSPISDLPPIISPTTQRQIDEAAAKRMMAEYGGGNSAGVATRVTTTTYQPVTRTAMEDEQYEVPAIDDPTAEIYEHISTFRKAIQAARAMEAADPTGMFVNSRDVTNLITAAQVLLGKAERMLDA